MIETAVLLSTGDEITTGKIADTNAQWLADRLVTLGIRVVATLVVGDYPDNMRWAWERAFELGDVVIATGGLGPTSDDLTTETVAAVLGVPVFRDEASAERVRQLFAAMKRPMPQNNLRQADFPQGSVILGNPLGTAPGYRMTLERRVRLAGSAVGGARRAGSSSAPLAPPDAGGPAAGGVESGPAGSTGPEAVRRRHIVVMPGVPREMKPMFDEQVVPWLRAELGSGASVLTHTFQTFGISESGLGEKVAEIVAPDEARIAYRAAFPQVSVRFTVVGSEAEARARLDGLAERIRHHLGAFIFGEGDVSMEAAMGEALKRRGATVAFAESCTGGLVSQRATAIAGSSAYLLASYVTYANDAKCDVLGVRRETLAAEGAVSEATAREMALGARRRSGASVAVSITGVAGPDGGTPDRPVGTVCFALSAAAPPDPAGSPPRDAAGSPSPGEAGGYLVSRRHQLWGNREWVRLLSSQLALDWVRRWALGLDVLSSGFRA